jgi:hypothetical protein
MLAARALQLEQKTRTVCRAIDEQLLDDHSQRFIAWKHMEKL